MAALSPDRDKLNVGLLAVCQALFQSGNSLMVSTAPLVGMMLSSNPAFATLPMSIQHAGVMCMTIPAALFMRRFGRRAGFMLGAVFGLIGAVGMAVGVVHGSFVAFCAFAFFIGCFNSTASFYRFAAADTAPVAFRPKAISLVLAGGIAAAIIGPELAKNTKDLLAPIPFAGAYVGMISLYVLVFCISARVKIAPPTAAERQEAGRPLLEIIRQPKCMFAMGTGVVSYVVMSLLMTTTPLAMSGCGFIFADSATVIQAHVLGMYLPSFFTGSLIARFGAVKIILAGVALNLVAVGADLHGLHFANFATGLFVMGIGWNFMFTGATTLLTSCYRPSERARVQGFNDFLIFASIALSAFSSGNLYQQFGWDVVNYVVLPPLLAILVAAPLLLRRDAAMPRPNTA